MQVDIQSKSSMTISQLKYFRERIFAAEHEADAGPRSVWDNRNYCPRFSVILLIKQRLPIGTFYIGGPKNSVVVDWWLDSRYRKQGYATEAIDLLATNLKIGGYTGVGRMSNKAVGDELIASQKLIDRFRNHFENR
jgi:hypothetical protein